jgi:hypothetical protein
LPRGQSGSFGQDREPVQRSPEAVGRGRPRPRHARLIGQLSPVIGARDPGRAPELLRIPESPAPVLRLALLGGYVYAPTAAVIHQFCQLALHGLTTRVAHFEQPVFAWR